MVDTAQNRNSCIVATPRACNYATFIDFHATGECNRPTTKSLKPLAGAALARNKVCNRPATDPLKSMQLLTEKNSEKVAWFLAENDRQKIISWLSQIGETDQEVIDDLLRQVTGDKSALAYFLKRADEVTGTITSSKCGNCINFKPHHAHGKGSGTCKAGGMPSGICHWSETVRTCNGFKAKEQPPCLF